MSENETSEHYIVDEDAEILGEMNQFAEHDAYENIRIQFEKCYFPFLIVIGVPCNILAFVILMRRRLWLHHEAYIYLAAILIVNAVTLAVFIGDLCLQLFTHQLVRLSVYADIICKLWNWAFYAIRYMNWLHVLMLLNVYLRQQLITSSDRRGCYMNLAAKCCTLFGTKVVISSFFIFCALANFLAFSIFGLEDYYDTWYCTISDHSFTKYMLLFDAYSLIEFLCSVIKLPLIFLVIWKRKRSSGFSFSQMNGAAQDNGDAEAIARIALCCAAANFVLRAPLSLDYFSFAFDFGPFFYHRIYKVLDALHLMAAAQPLSTPIVCFAVKSRIRDDLKAIIQRCCYRCCPGAKFHITLPPEPQSDGSSVLQMNPIEEDSSVTIREEDQN